jgi:large subunit ribosomal protein L32
LAIFPHFFVKKPQFSTAKLAFFASNCKKIAQKFISLEIVNRLLGKKGTYMAVPARRTSKSKKNKRRTHYKLTAPTIQFDELSGEYRRSHRINLKAYKAAKTEK